MADEALPSCARAIRRSSSEGSPPQRRRAYRYRRLAVAVLSLTLFQVHRRGVARSEDFVGATAQHPSARLAHQGRPAQPRDGSKSSEAPKTPYGEQDPMELMKQLFGGDFSNPPGGPGQEGMENPFASLMGAGGQQKKKTSDSFFTDKFPILQKLKRPVLVAFFLYCFHRGWVGRWGLLSGMMAGSYFDMLAVPLRVLDKSPCKGRAYIVTQIYVDYLFKLVGYGINVAKGKAKFPPDFSAMFTPPGGAGAGANPFGAPGANPFSAPGANPFADLGGNNPFDFGIPDAAPPGGAYQAPPVQPTDMPTASTVRPPTPVPPPTPRPVHMATEPATTPMAPPKPPPSRNPPPVIDADVVFLD